MLCNNNAPRKLQTTGVQTDHRPPLKTLCGGCKHVCLHQRASSRSSRTCRVDTQVRRPPYLPAVRSRHVRGGLAKLEEPWSGRGQGGTGETALHAAHVLAFSPLRRRCQKSPTTSKLSRDHSARGKWRHDWQLARAAGLARRSAHPSPPVLTHLWFQRMGRARPFPWRRTPPNHDEERASSSEDAGGRRLHIMCFPRRSHKY